MPRPEQSTRSPDPESSKVTAPHRDIPAKPTEMTTIAVHKATEDPFGSILEKTYRRILSELALYETTKSEINYNDWLAEQTNITEKILAQVSEVTKSPLDLQRLTSSLHETLKESEPIRHAKIDLMKTLAGLVKSRTQVLISSQTWSQQITFDWIINCRSVKDVMTFMQDSDASKILLEDYSCFDSSCKDEFSEAKLKEAERIFTLIITVQEYCKGMKDKLKRLGPCANDALETCHSECLEATKKRRDALDTQLKSVFETLVEEAKQQFEFCNSQDMLLEEKIECKIELEEGEITENENRLAADKKRAQQESMELVNKYQTALNQKLSLAVTYSQEEVDDIHDQIKNQILGDFNTKFGHLMELDFEEIGAAMDAEFEKVQEVQAQKREESSDRSASSKPTSNSPKITRKPLSESPETEETSSSIATSSHRRHRRRTRSRSRSPKRTSDRRGSSKTCDRKTSSRKSSTTVRRSNTAVSEVPSEPSQIALSSVSQNSVSGCSTSSSISLLARLREKLQEQARLKATRSSDSATTTETEDQNGKSLTSSHMVQNQLSTATPMSPSKRLSSSDLISDFEDDTPKRARATSTTDPTASDTPASVHESILPNLLSVRTAEIPDKPQLSNEATKTSQEATSNPTETCTSTNLAESEVPEPSNASLTCDFLNILITETNVILNARVNGLETTRTLSPSIAFAVNSSDQVVLPWPGSGSLVRTVHIMECLTNPDGFSYVFRCSGTNFCIDKILSLYFSLEIIRPLCLKQHHLSSLPVRVAIPSTIPLGSRQHLLNGIQEAGFINLPEDSIFVQLTTAVAFGLPLDQLQSNIEHLIVAAYQQTTYVEAALIQVTKTGFHTTKTAKMALIRSPSMSIFSLIAPRNMAKIANVDPNSITNKYLFIDPAASCYYHQRASKWTTIYDPNIVLAGLRRISELCANGQKLEDLYQEKFPIVS